jgi:AcrR family transcriptional regulator
MGTPKFAKSSGKRLAARRNSGTTHRGYSAHRERQRLRILAAAESLFSPSGIDSVSMLDITNAAGVQPSTLYQYFKSKEEIVWALATESLRSFRDRARTHLDGEMPALAKVRAVLELMAEDLEERPQDVRFMAQFDVLYARDFSAESVRKMTRDLGMDGFADFSRWVNEGIADGSLRPDLNPDLSLIALFNAAIGTQRRLGSLGPKAEQEYGKSASELFRESMRLLVDGLSGSRAATATIDKTDAIRKSRRRKQS